MLRSILNEVFEHSSKDGCFPVGNKAGTAHEAPSNNNKSIATDTAHLIDLTLDDEISSDSSPKSSYSELAYGVSSSGESSDEISEFEPDELASFSGSFCRKRKYSSLKEPKGKGRAEEKTMQGVLSDEAFIRLYIPCNINHLSKLIL